MIEGRKIVHWQCRCRGRILRGPFGLMIPGGGVGAGAQRAHVDEPFDTGLPRGGHYILRAERVNVFKRALSDFTDDTTR